LLPKKLPRTIEDAIKVTLQLGFRYLWIDRYCISQNNFSEKHLQIQSMASVYGTSEVTIIAAAGSGPDYGLPGRGKQHRRPQPKLQLGKHTLVSAMWCARQVVPQTTWSARAWTYQEAVLSRRKLIFTDEQVYFQCFNSAFCESLAPESNDMIPMFQPAIEPPVGQVSEIQALRSFIEAYSSKTLSYESNILNAIMGIFRTFESGKNPIFTFCGVPILLPMSITGKPIERSLEAGFVTALYWKPDVSCRTKIIPRPGFPSWSWTGWHQKVDTLLWSRYEDLGGDFGITVKTKTDKG
jgi:hypothetical protein